MEDQGAVTVVQAPRQVVALRPARFDDGRIALSAVRTPTGPALEVPVAAMGLDPAGVERQLATATLGFEAGAAEAEVALDLPAELRNRVTRFELPGTRSAAAVSLTDDGLRRREVGLVAGSREKEQLDLLSPLHYLREALAPTADLVEGTLSDVVAANPDAIALVDVAGPRRGRGGGAGRLGRGGGGCCCASRGRGSPARTFARRGGPAPARAAARGRGGRWAAR
jgi:hypothetical protein